MIRQRQGAKAVLVSARPWSKDMVKALETRTSCGFELISDPRELTMERLTFPKAEICFLSTLVASH